MISDEELKAVSGVDVNLILKNYCLVFKIPQAEAEAAMGPVMRAQEMAQELLQRREAERNAKSWENAPEWANWYARDAGWFYRRKPQPGDSGEWENLAGVAEPAMHDGWETSLQERPK